MCVVWCGRKRLPIGIIFYTFLKIIVKFDFYSLTSQFNSYDWHSRYAGCTARVGEMLMLSALCQLIMEVDDVDIIHFRSEREDRCDGFGEVLAIDFTVN